ncbi:DUF1963 domain-containing protein [Kitasatospora sp. NPDC059646]|uniref:DUF1963 domain-containing protein n=1 Tax=Kitasatospora sp. NPDC059646 TaxID=3346893 RepID=UPI003683D2FA
MNDDLDTRVGRFRATAAEEGLPPEYVERWIRAVRPAVYLAAGGDGPTAAVLGGEPLLPADEPLAASVDLAALPPGATGLPLPADGWLLLFGEPVIGGPRPPAAGAVRYVPAGATPFRRAGDDGAATLWAQPCSPMDDSFALDTWGEDADDEQCELADELATAWASTGGHRPPWILQLGGHPASPQFDPVHDARDETGEPDWALLASYRPGEAAGAPDSAVIHWLIRPADLTARRFDRVRRYVDMA